MISNKYKLISTIILMGVGLALVGCNKEVEEEQITVANDKNFTKAIEAYHYQRDFPNCMFEDFPVEAIVPNKGFEAFRDIGLLSRETVEAGWEYSLTGEGEKYVRDNDYSTKDKRSTFCFGDIKVNITYFTPPRDDGVFTSSIVKYTYQVENLPAWVKNKQVNKAHPHLKEQIREIKKGSAYLILTNKGWTHKKLFDK